MRPIRSVSKKRRVYSVCRSGDGLRSCSRKKSVVSSASSRLVRERRSGRERHYSKSLLGSPRSRRGEESRRHYVSRSMSRTSSRSLSHRSLCSRSRRYKGHNRFVQRSFSRSLDYYRNRRPRQRSTNRNVLRDYHHHHHHDPTKRREELSCGKTSSSYWDGSSKKKWDGYRHTVKPYGYSQVQHSPPAPLDPHKGNKETRFSRKDQGRRLTLERGAPFSHRRPDTYPPPVNSHLASTKHDDFLRPSRMMPAKPFGHRNANYKPTARPPFMGQRTGRRRANSPATWSHDQYFEISASGNKQKRAIVNLYAETFDQLIVGEPE